MMTYKEYNDRLLAFLDGASTLLARNECVTVWLRSMSSHTSSVNELSKYGVEISPDMRTKCLELDSYGLDIPISDIELLHGAIPVIEKFIGRKVSRTNVLELFRRNLVPDIARFIDNKFLGEIMGVETFDGISVISYMEPDGTASFTAAGSHESFDNAITALINALCPKHANSIMTLINDKK